VTTFSRVTETGSRTRVLANLQRALDRGQELQDQLSSGKQIRRPSDSPSGTVTALQLRGEVRATQQYARNADDGEGWLGVIQDTMSNVSAQVNKARDLTVQALNSGAGTGQSDEALAVEIDNLRASLIESANTKFMNRPVFGGTTAGSVAYDANGAYVGDDGQTTRTVGSNTKLRVDTTGPEAFGTGDTQLFAVLKDISDKIRSGDKNGLNQSIQNLDSAGDLLKSTLSDVGARYNRITQMKQSAQDRLLTVTSQLSDIEDVDLPKTIMELQVQQTSYQAALAASAKVIQPSLIDFLR
jgi:flagellar hook-associated protein 3 FlgL